ncbi:DUF1542 domain-containing protein, partial [Granulicatella sp. zg-84]|uniref:DUF1542 domain-containing protein n=1 Tax=Granulicatella sp. zg-84 TaxID=2678503 RepID=UPI0013BF64CA
MFYKRKDRFSIRKFKIGVGSVFLGSFLLASPQVFAHKGEYVERLAEFSSTSVDSESDKDIVKLPDAVQVTKTITFEDFKKMTLEDIKALTVEDFEVLKLTDEDIASLSPERQKALTTSKTFQSFNRKDLSLPEGFSFRDGATISGLNTLNGSYGWTSREGNDVNVAMGGATIERLEIVNGLVNVRVKFNGSHDNWKTPFYYVTIPKGLEVTNIDFGSKDGNLYNYSSETDWAENRSDHVGNEKRNTRVYSRNGNGGNASNIGNRTDRNFNERWIDLIGWHIDNSRNTTQNERNIWRNIRDRTYGILSFETEQDSKEYYLNYSARVKPGFTVNSVNDLAIAAGLKSNQVPATSNQNYARAFLKPYVPSSNPSPTPSPSTPSSQPVNVGKADNIVVWTNTSTDSDIVIARPTGNIPKIYLAENERKHLQAGFPADAIVDTGINDDGYFVLKAGSLFKTDKVNTPMYTKVVKASNIPISEGDGLGVSNPFVISGVYAPDNMTLEYDKEKVEKFEVSDDIVKHITFPRNAYVSGNNISASLEEVYNKNGEKIDNPQIKNLRGNGILLKYLLTIESDEENNRFVSGVSKYVYVTLNLIDKEKAKKEIDDAKKAKDEQIDANTQLTDEEKTTAKAETEKAANKAKDAIEKAKNQSEIDTPKQTGISEIAAQGTPTKKPSAVEEINRVKAEKEAEINASSLTEEEKNVAKRKITTASTNAINAINNAITDSAVDTAKQNGIESLKVATIYVGEPKDVYFWSNTSFSKDVEIATTTGEFSDIYVADPGYRTSWNLTTSGIVLNWGVNDEKKFVVKQGTKLLDPRTDTLVWTKYVKVPDPKNDSIHSYGLFITGDDFKFYGAYLPEAITLNRPYSSGNEDNDDLVIAEVMKKIKFPNFTIKTVGKDSNGNPNRRSLGTEENKELLQKYKFIAEEYQGTDASVDNIGLFKGKGNTIRFKAITPSGLEKEVIVTLNYLDKETAVQALAEKQQEVNTEIDANANLSLEEKEKAKEKVRVAIDTAIKAIEAATDENRINAAKSAGLKAIELEKERAEAVGVIERAKAAKDTAIDEKFNNKELTETERDDAKKAAKQAADTAKEAID